jgi:transcriptional regulator
MTLYRPAHYQVQEESHVRDFVSAHPFATLVCPQAGAVSVTHLPLLLSAGSSPQMTLAGHVAVRNPQADDLRTGREVLAIFQGPHAYVSPLWYEDPAEVPTLNYIAVHAHGTPQVVADREKTVQYFELLNDYYEAHRSPRWSVQYLSAGFMDRMLQEIVAFEVRVTSVEAKFKLSQNRRPADRANVRRNLAASGDALDAEIVGWMKRLGIGD